MSENNIEHEIQLIKDLIADARMEPAMDQLKKLIKDIDGELEKPEERNLQNQLVAIRGRYNIAEKNRQANPGSNNTELSIVIQSLIALIDETEKVALDNAALLAKEPVANLATSEEVYTAYMPIEKGKAQVADPSKNQGCLLAFANKGANVNIEVKSFSFLRPLLGVASVLLVVGTFYILRPDSIAPTTPITTNPTGPSPGEQQTIPPPPPLGKNATEMGFRASSTEAEMADFLSDPNGTKTKKFSLNAVAFNKNKIGLNSESKKELDNIAALLKEYPDAYIDIYGMITDDESATYRGNKEITLDEYRGKSAYNYLKSRGITADQMSFEGDGILKRRSIDFKLTR